MANNYAQFSESINELSEEEADWMNKALRAKPEELCNILGLDFTSTVDIEDWPCFAWQLDYAHPTDLWLHDDAGEFATYHLILFVQAFLRKFRPKDVFTMTVATTCSAPRLREFGGWWLAISMTNLKGGNTRDAVIEAAKLLEKENNNEKA